MPGPYPVRAYRAGYQWRQSLYRPHHAAPRRLSSSESLLPMHCADGKVIGAIGNLRDMRELDRSEEHTSELQSHRDLHSFPTRRSSDLILDQAVRVCQGLIQFAHIAQDTNGANHFTVRITQRRGV